jgi:NodT family efflux transporter outer membrane factor (OMF) lipoprotein
MTFKYLIPVFVTATLAACAVGPDFKRPDPPAVTAYTSAVAAGEQRITLGESPPLEWWTLFRSNELNTLMQQAVQSNLTLTAARASLAQAQELVIAQAGARYPQVDLDAGTGRQKLGAQFLGNFQIPPFTYYSVGANVRYTLDYTGGIARSIEQRQALADYQKHELDAAYLALTGNVAIQSLTIASMRAQIRAVEELIGEDRSNVDLVRAAFEAGAVTRVDLLSAQSQLAQDETLLPPLRQRLSVAQNALAILVGQAPLNGPSATLDWSQIQLPQSVPVTLPSELVHRRPDILAAEAQLHAATAEVGIATANLYPQITLSGLASQQALTTDRLFNSASFAWDLIGGITAPLFDGGTLRAERRAAIQAVHVTAANYQQTVLQSFEQIANLLQALQHDAELLTAQSTALDTARSSVDLARESYRAGNVGVLEVLDAERQSQQARLGYLRAQEQRYVDTVQLLLATGGSLPETTVASR